MHTVLVVLVRDIQLQSYRYNNALIVIMVLLVF